MRPPICELCGGEAEKTLSFADYEPLPDGMTGHPRGLAWICDRHLRAARRLADRSQGAAVVTLRSRVWSGRLVASGLVVLALVVLAVRAC